MEKNQNNGNSQLNTIREDFNSKTEAKAILGKTKRVKWSSRRRFRSI